MLAKWSQIRRCHRCGETHEENGTRVIGCKACGAHFAPYFYSELTPEALAQPIVKAESLVLKSAKKFRPVIGVTWWWNDSDSLSGESTMPKA